MTYDIHTEPDIHGEMQIMHEGRLVKARLPDLPAPNVSWYWIPLGNCKACKYNGADKSGYPKCLNAKITPREFFDVYTYTVTCPQFEAGTPGESDMLDVMRAVGLAPGKPGQRVEVIHDKPWNIETALRAHEEQAQFIHMAGVADYVARGGVNDPLTLYSGGYTDLSSDLEEEWARREANNPVPDSDPEDAALATDAGGREHRGKGEGGGQFTKGNGGSANTHKAPKVGSTVKVSGSNYVVEPLDSDDSFPPAISSYEVLDGYLVYHGRNGSEGVVSGTAEEVAKWVRDVDKTIRDNPPADSEITDWEPSHGGEGNIKKAQAAGVRAAQMFGIEPVPIKFGSRKADHGIGGDNGHGSVSVINAHKDLPAAFDFEAPDVTRGMHFAAHEMLHKVYEANSDLGKQIAGKLSKIAPRVSLYGSIAGPLELLMETGAAYVTAPDSLKRSSPEAFALMEAWSKEARGNAAPPS